ncbi:MAG: phosphoribosylformylglycinamidine cyclo-ligase, partial [Pseudomonadota bacterium]|nr:phosphoribosylformylglycinamidine cyclo-ligase [Pseudomonadota bacterium]
MRRTFNCGVGMVMIVSPSAADSIKNILEAEKEQVYRLGVMVRQPIGSVIIHD